MDGNSDQCELREKFNLFGWCADEGLSDDENFMDLLMLITRSSQLKQGSMACIIASDVKTTKISSFFDRVICAETNRPLFKENSSDIHAEIAAIGNAAKNGLATKGAVAYITMPPCKRCFAALVTAGIGRIVTRHDSDLKDIAAKINIEMVRIPATAEQSSRIDALVRKYREDQGLPVKKAKTENKSR